MGFRHIAIAGASQSPQGHSTGFAIARKALETKKRGAFDSVVILGRKQSAGSKQASIQELVSLGAEYHAIDYADIEGTAKALRELRIDCVISCLSVADPQAIGEAEVQLVKAAGKGGVKRFFPSQYGPDDERLPAERVWRISVRKAQSADLVKSLGMEVTKVVTGMYYEAFFTNGSVMDWSDKDGKFTGHICGPEGMGTVSAIALDDIANFVVAMIADPDTSKTANKTVRINGDVWKTGEELNLFEQVTGKRVDRVRHPLGDPIKDRSEYPQYPRLLAGNHYLVDPSLVDNHLFPSVKPITLREWIQRNFVERGYRSLNFPQGPRQRL